MQSTQVLWQAVSESNGFWGGRIDNVICERSKRWRIEEKTSFLFLDFLTRSSLERHNVKLQNEGKKERKVFHMHERVKKKVKWSGLQWFLSFALFSLSTMPFDCEFHPYEYVNEVLSFDFYRLLDFIAFWWWWWWRFDKNEIKILHFLWGLELSS